MRVGIAGFGYGLGRRGGVQVYLDGLLRALEAHAPAGDELTLLLGPDDPDPAGLRRLRRVRLARSPFTGSTWRRAARLLLRARDIDALGLDVVHYPQTRLEGRAPRTPVALTFFDMQEELLPDLFAWRERWARRLVHRSGVRRARIVIAPSVFTRETLRRVYGAPETKLRVVPPGVEPAYFAAGAAHEAAGRAPHGLAAGEYLLYPAHAWPHKNHARLLRALARLDARPGGAPPLVCCGRLASTPACLEEQAARAGLRAGRVRDLGFVPPEELPALVSGARALVFPSLFEGFGLPVAEALAAGCAVACSDLPPLREIAGDAARLFDPRDEAALAEAVAEVWESARLRERLRAAGRARAEAFRWERLVPRLRAAYQAAAEAPG